MQSVRSYWLHVSQWQWSGRQAAGVDCRHDSGSSKHLGTHRVSAPSYTSKQFAASVQPWALRVTFHRQLIDATTQPFFSFCALQCISLINTTPHADSMVLWTCSRAYFPAELHGRCRVHGEIWITACLSVSGTICTPRFMMPICMSMDQRRATTVPDWIHCQFELLIKLPLNCLDH